jgi:hypothetical protein
LPGSPRVPAIRERVKGVDFKSKTSGFSTENLRISEAMGPGLASQSKYKSAGLIVGPEAAKSGLWTAENPAKAPAK